LILSRTSTKQFDKLSIMTTFADVFYITSTTVWDPMNPSPPVTKRVLILVVDIKTVSILL